MDLDKIKKFTADAVENFSEREIKDEDFKEFLWGSFLGLMITSMDRVTYPKIEDTVDFISVINRLNIDFLKGKVKEKIMKEVKSAHPDS